MAEPSEKWVAREEDRQMITVAASLGPRSIRDDWFINIMSDSSIRSTGLQERSTYSMPRIQRVQQKLKKIEGDKKCFTPVVASIGPYHHGKQDFKMIENLKIATARRFVSDCGKNIQVVFNEVEQVATQARECYADGSTDEFDDEYFARIMFLDGCFVLHFIECLTNNSESEFSAYWHIAASLLRDLFLLENQLPYVVLQVLMDVRFYRNRGEKMVNEFINRQVNPQGSHRWFSTARVDKPPLHLLDLLRMKFLGDSFRYDPSEPSQIVWRSFHSIIELKKMGIRLRRSHTRCLKDINFRSFKVHGELSLPSIVIDEWTKEKFLNLVAYEMCSDASHNYEVISYICFLDSLISGVDDVKELCSKGIFLNFLGSDEKLIALFKQLATELAPDPCAYYTVKKGIEMYYQTKLPDIVYSSVGEFLQNHCRNPLTAFAFFTACFIIFLTCVQTYFAVFPHRP